MASLGFHIGGGGGGLFAVASSHTHLSSKLLLHHQRLVQHHPTPGHLRLLLPAKPTNSIDIYTPTTNWAGFAEKVSGEWDGYGADFTKEGEPIQLPESVVPEAFREWEVQVFDWQTQCPTLALPQPHLPFSYKLIRLLPTVGCEADAATRYSILERNINTAMAFAYDESGGGSYVAVWAEDGRVVELEHCLVDPRGGGGETESRSRVRIIQEVRLMQLESIKVFCEQWYGPFRNGDQLGGCAIRDSAFASTPPLQSSSISGDWLVFRHASATFHQEENMKIKQLVVVEENGSTSRNTRDGNTLILLPKQLWCSYHQQHRDPETNCFQVGWLLDEGFAITSTCTFSSDANLKEIAITHENLQT